MLVSWCGYRSIARKTLEHRRWVICSRIPEQNNGNFLVEDVHMKDVVILPGLQLVYKADEQSHHSW
jgi:hypothetical protein